MQAGGVLNRKKFCSCEGERLLSLDLVDHVIVDPPYSPRTHKATVTTFGNMIGAVHNDLGFAALTPHLRAAIAMTIAGARGVSAVFTDDDGIHAWVDTVKEYGGEKVRVIPWVRWSMPQLSADRPPQGAEYVVLFAPARKHKKFWLGSKSLTHFDFKCMRGAGKHKTQKPLPLMLELVASLSKPGETLVDMTMGRGTTCKAAQMLGRGFIGYEVDEVEFTKAEARMRKTDDKDRADFAKWVARGGKFKIREAGKLGLLVGVH